MDPFARLLELLALLQGSPVWTSEEIAERLGTTPRTVRRDVARLRELGYRIASEPGRFGGYRLDRGRAVPPLVLTPEEATALAIGLRAAGPAGIAGLDAAAAGALTKLEGVLPPAAWARVEALEAATVRLPREVPADVDPQVLVVLATAVRDGQRVRLHYRAADGAESRRRVDPLALVHTGTRWYLVAHDLERGAWRNFRVDRVLRATTHGTAALPADVPDPVELVLEGTALAAYPWQAEVELDLPLRWARARVPPSVGRLAPLEDDRTLLRIGSYDLDHLAAFVVGLGCDFLVRGPHELEEAIRSLGARLAAR